MTSDDRAIDIALENRDALFELRREMERDKRALATTLRALRATAAGLIGAITAIEELSALDVLVVHDVKHSSA